MKKKITIVGTGYVGLVTGTCFAETGNHVICVDKDEDKIKRLKKGEIPIYEPGLSDLIGRNVKQGLLNFSTDLKSSIEEVNVVFIAVGTPEGEDGSADLSHVKAVAEELGNYIKKYTVVVNKSTVPVGTGAIVKKIINDKAPVEIDIVSNPEFLKEGSAVKDFLKPDRVVIGYETEKALEVMTEIYSPFLINSHPIISMDIKSAEITKYASNSMLATKISFINEISRLCDKVGADITRVRQGMITDVRIGPHFLYPGIGYGGSCFPKDVKAVIKTADDYQLDFTMLKVVDKVNDLQKLALAEKINTYYKNQLAGKTFAIWGLAFKPETDDMREAPSIEMINFLLSQKATVKVNDPEAIEVARRLFGDQIKYCDEKYDTVKEVDALILCTEWMNYRQVDFDRLKHGMKHPVIFDGRNLWYQEIKKLDFDWMGIGVPSIFNYSNS